MGATGYDCGSASRVQSARCRYLKKKFCQKNWTPTQKNRPGGRSVCVPFARVLTGAKGLLHKSPHGLIVATTAQMLGDGGAVPKRAAGLAVIAASQPRVGLLADPRLASGKPPEITVRQNYFAQSYSGLLRSTT
jgi:hypothetical protein